MKLNRNCPAFNLCDLNNLKVGELWGHECPYGLKSGKRDFTQCDYYQIWERDGAIPKHDGASRKREEAV